METMTQTASDIMDEIRSANQNFERNFADGNAEGMASLYTSDGMLLPPGAAVQEGSKAIQGFWQMVMNLGVKRAQLSTVQVDKQNDMAVEMGNYKLSGGDNQLIDEGKYIVVWKKQNGDWKLHKDIWNTNLSPQSNN